MKLTIGDKAIYGRDPRLNGFPLQADSIGTVTKLHVNSGVQYATVTYGNGKNPSVYPVSSFTKL